METVVEYNQLSDLTPEDREFVEFCAGQPIEELDIDEVNDFLNGYAQFCRGLDEG
jgi:hypothetical protein